MDPKQCFARLAMTTAHVFGPATKRSLISELQSLKHLIPKRGEREQVVDQLVASGQLEEVEVDGVSYLWIRDEWQQDEVRGKVRIVTPFDPLVRDRQRFEQVWGWRAIDLRHMCLQHGVSVATMRCQCFGERM